MSEGRVIHRLLVANRGEIARRVFRTCRELGIATVAVYSEPDALAPFVREADCSVPLGGATPEESYLRGDAIVEAAKRTGADAIHPGYGFLSENAEFAQRVMDAGLIWVGPPPEAIGAMGSKVEARRRMEQAEVPIVPGRTLEDGNHDGGLSEAAEAVGFPLLVKASAGGGGKGMRIVRDPEDLSDAAEGARREASASFGDETIFFERYVDEPRHVEIQIMADTHGKVVSLFERDCSIQRRHQKVVEESPCPVLSSEQREEMGRAAIGAAEELGYVGAGTVEFLLTPDGDFFFLEVNTRLQVEHPVTEAVTGLDLVRLQILVAEGRPLPPEAIEPVMEGHAIEVRLYAEDPENDFLPVTGTLERFAIPDGLRVDSGFESGTEVSPFYDPMLAKVIAHAPTRLEAARALASGLERAEIDGLVTNRDFLVRVLRHPEFLEGRTDTHFLERHEPAELGAPALDEEAEGLHAAAAALAEQVRRRRQARVLGTIPSGWRNDPTWLQRVTLHGRSGDIEVGYRFDRTGELAVLAIRGDEVQSPRLHASEPDEVDLEVDGVRRRYRVRLGEETVYVHSELGQAALEPELRFPTAVSAAPPGSLTAPMPGSVLRLPVSRGDTVEEGQTVMVLEAMKMEHEITAPSAGTVSELDVGEGDHVESGQVLAVVEAEGVRPS